MGQWYIITGDSVNWCGYREERRVFAESEQHAEELCEQFYDYMQEYVGQNVSDEEDDVEDSAECTFLLELWDPEVHCPIEDYQDVE